MAQDDVVGMEYNECTPLSTNFPARQGVAKNNMACNIGETAAGPFLFIEAGKQGEAHELKNYIMVDNRGWPMS